MMRRFLFWGGILFVALFVGRLEATMTLPVSLQQMTAQAGQIFVGRCVAVEASHDERGLPATYVTFEILQSIKGVDSDQVTVKHFGWLRSTDSEPMLPDLAPGEAGIVRTLRTVTTPYRYQPDEEVILFLYPESRWGFTSPIGYGQGLFRVSLDADGWPTVRNAYNNLLLRFSGDNQTKGLPALSTGGASTPGIDYGEFLSVVEGMVSP